MLIAEFGPTGRTHAIILGHPPNTTIGRGLRIRLAAAIEGTDDLSRTARTPYAEKVREVVNINQATGIDVARGIAGTPPLLKEQ